MRLTSFLGVCGGFLLAYQRSSCACPDGTRSVRSSELTVRAAPLVRFMGLTENKAERDKDMKELSARAAAGKPLYGESDLDDYLQGVAMRNSLWSQLKLGAMPW